MACAGSVVALGTVLAALFFSGSWAAQQDPAALLRQYTDALNRGDAEGAVAVFTDDAVVTGNRGPLCVVEPCIGAAAIRREMERRVADQHNHTLADITVSGDTVTSRTQVVSGRVHWAGVERSIRTETVESRDGKIVRYHIEADLDDPETALFLARAAADSALRGHFEALNRGEVDRALATFASDAEMVRGLLCPHTTPCVGTEAIRRELEIERESAGDFVVLEVLPAQGSEVTLNIKYEAPGGRGERVMAAATVTFLDARIAHWGAETGPH